MIILREHRVTRRFEKNDRRVAFVAVQQREIVASQLRGFVEIALAEGGPSATFALHRQHDFKARGFEHLDGGHADVSFVIAHERIVPKHDAAAIGRPERRAFGKPMIEPLQREIRQQSFGGNAQHAAQERSIQQHIGHARQLAAQPAQLIHGTEQPFVQGQSTPVDARVL